MEAAFGVQRFEDVICSEPLYGEFVCFLDDYMSGAIAETNAEAFEIEDLVVVDFDYDSDLGGLTLNLCFKYTGDQHPDKPWCGNSFEFAETELRLFWRHDNWKFSMDSPFEVFVVKSDRELDYQERWERAPGRF